MAELVIGPLVSMVKEKVSSYLLDQYKVMEGMEQQRAILERKLPAILDVIEDAEEKGVFRPGVSAWLRALKKVTYEANDVFDEFNYEALRRDARKKGQYNMGKKVGKIVKSIEVLVSEMNGFGFIHRQQPPPSNQWRQTDSIISDFEKDIIRRSRDKEQKRIVKILLDHVNSNRDLLVLPILGLGGLGKTIFAQLIYNDPEIKNQFEFRRWCCVSVDFDIGNIANSICNNTGKDHEKALMDLQEEISGKRYLIVLDDVWNRKADKWGKLRTCLQLGSRGSAILTTTRDAEVARIMVAGVVEAYILENLADNYVKEIIQSRASSLANSDELSEILGKFVCRCHGSPLAAKAFGSMLSTKTSILEWKNILAKSDICNEKTGILPILKLSYEDLSSHMKQCFAFCAIFPKGYEIDVENLIQLWMAHEFIPLEENGHFEMLGKEIFKELAWRSFFQDVKRSPPQCRNGERAQLCYTSTCKIHDLMHDVALHVVGKECVTITDGRNHKELLSNHPTYHLLFSRYRTGALLDGFVRKQSSNLRTLLCPKVTEYCSIPHLSKCNSLRALQLFEITELPIGPMKLKHLRYLNISENSEIKELPKDISILYNLQTLNVSHCTNLRRLPKDMKYMTSLQHLYTNGCTKLKCMPPDLGCLTSLQTLTYFMVGSIPGCSTVRELQYLNLCGELELCGLENVSEAHAGSVSLEYKVNLTHLSLEWSSNHLVDESNCNKRVLDALKPHDGLQMLRIGFYQGTVFPTWMTDLNVLQNLTELYLVDCTMCEEFPQFCHMKALQVLCLTRLDKMQNLCRYTTSTVFPALKDLQLNDLERLQGWLATDGKEKLACPLLEKVDITNCPMLKSIPEVPKLQILKLDEKKAQLSLSVLGSRYISSLSKLILSVSDTNAILQLDQNSEISLLEMELCGCSFFFPSGPFHPAVGIWKWFGQLVDLKIESCDVLIYWPEEEFAYLVSLKNLTIGKCNNLICPRPVNRESTRVSSDQLLPCLTSLSIRSCGSLQQLFRLPQTLTHISIYGCKSLESIWGEDDTDSTRVLQVERNEKFTWSEHCNNLASTSALEKSPSQRNNSLPCLERLAIGACHSLVALQHLPPSLKILRIMFCENLLSVQVDALKHSLERLLIVECEKLCSISGQLDALQCLRIERSKLESLDCLGDLQSLEGLYLKDCRCLTSVPGCHGRYPLLQDITIKYCPAINLKPLYERLQPRFDNLEIRDLSDAHSRNPINGPMLRDPWSWKYAIPGCGYWCSEDD
uniref:NB-ARC domain-containing protein n=1 Tax=Leersia perrieri TaxID=77586 RepID=A0A0D9XHJ7_9ORYZ